MDADTAERLQAVDEHLRATETLPVDRTASAYLGEAAAVAGDLVAERLGHVVDLLSAVEGTGNERADDHVEAALTAAREARRELTV